MAIKDALNKIKNKYLLNTSTKDYSAKENKFKKIIDEKINYYDVRNDFMKKSKEALNYKGRLYGASKELIEELYASMHNMKEIGNELFNEYSFNPSVNESFELISLYLSKSSTAKEDDYMGELENLFCPNKLDGQEACFSKEHDSLASILNIKIKNGSEELSKIYNETKNHIKSLMLLGSKILREYHDIDYKLKNNGNPAYMRHIKSYENEALKKIQEPLVNLMGKDILLKKK